MKGFVYAWIEGSWHGNNGGTQARPEHPVWLVKGAEWPSQVSPKLETDKNQRNGQLLIKTWLVWADC